MINTDFSLNCALTNMKYSEATQLCLSLRNPIDCSLPGSSTHGILQARILEWVAISFSRDLPDPGIKPRSPGFDCRQTLYCLSHIN